MPVITTLIAIIAAALPAIGPVSLALGTAGFGFATGSWAIASAIVYGTLAVGLSYAQYALARTQTGQGGGIAADSPASINAPEVRGNVKSATPSQRIPIGELRTGGAMFLYEVKPPYLYIGFLYSSLPISDYGTLYVGEKKIAFASLPENTIVSPLAVDGQPNFAGRLQVCVQRGSLNQGRNALIASDFPEFDEHFLTPGVANVVFKCDYGDDADEFLALWGNVQIPSMQWVLKGVPLPDPRVPGHRLSFDMNDPEDFYNAIATWSYNDTAALAQAFWAMMPFGLKAGPARIDWQKSVKESANFDDEAVPLADGGSQKRYVVSCLATLADKPNTVMEAMFTANRGFPSQHAGLFKINSSQPREPVLTITDDMLIGGFEFRRLKPKKDLVNIGRCRFISPDDEWQDADGPVLRLDDLIESDGEELEQTVRLSCTPTYQRAQRLLKGFVAEARLDKFLTCHVSMRAYGLREGMIVRRFSETDAMHRRMVCTRSKNGS
ncbi:MAG: hypothetical protein WDN48_06100 [Pseudolabrys sp.]